MWASESMWFEVSVVSIIFVIGNILLGHFEEHTPKIRRIAKYLLTVIIVVSISHFSSRIMAMSFLTIALMPVLYIHLISLPKKGINGWTAEPKEKYYELRGWDKNKLKQ